MRIKWLKTAVSALFILIGGNLVGQQRLPIDLVLLLDTSSVMSNYYARINDYLTGPFLRDNLRLGDTFHLIAFSDKPRMEIARRVEGRGDLETVITRMLLMYPLEPQADISAALSFVEHYAENLNSGRQRKIVVLSLGGGAASFPLLLEESRRRLERHSISLEHVDPAALPQAAPPAPPVPQPAPRAETPTPQPVTPVPQPAPRVETPTPRPVTPVPQPAPRVETPRPERVVPVTPPETPRQEPVPPEPPRAEAVPPAPPAIPEPVPARQPEPPAAEAEPTASPEPSAAPVKPAPQAAASRAPAKPADRRSPLIDQVLALIRTYGLWILGGLALGLLGLLIFFLVRRLRQSPNRVIAKASHDDSPSRKTARDAAPPRRTVPYRPSRAAGPYTDTGRPVKLEYGSPLMLKLFVVDQNTLIGKRNTHLVKPGFSYTIGGGKSDFLIFLVPVPPRLGDLKYETSGCTFYPRKPHYFPDIGNNPVHDCIGKTIRVISDKGYELFFRLEQYEDPLVALNRLMLAINVPNSTGS